MYDKIHYKLKKKKSKKKKKKLISHRTKGEKGGLSCDKSGERRPTLPLSTIPGGARPFPPRGPNQQRPGVLTQGRGTPGPGSGDCVGLTWVRIRYLETTYLLFTRSVSCRLWDSQHLNCGCCLINLWSFFFCSHCHVHVKSGTFGWVVALCSGEWKPLEASH